MKRLSGMAGPVFALWSPAGPALRVLFALAAATKALERASAGDDSLVMDSGSGSSGSEFMTF